MDEGLKGVVLGVVDDERIHDRLNYGAFVSEKYKFMYMETPKNACTTTKKIYNQLMKCPETADVHVRVDRELRPSILDLEPDHALGVLTSDAYFRFCILRDPVQRLISGYKNKMRSKSQNPSIDRTQRQIRRQYNIAGDGDITFEAFTNFVIDQPDDLRNTHWMKQVSVNLIPKIKYDFCVTLENYTRDMGFVLDTIKAPKEVYELISKVHNPSRADPITIPPKLISRIEQAYSEDMEYHLQALDENKQRFGNSKWPLFGKLRKFITLC